jgi:ADP-L-glycero-D-manno-heptose 6-epimerase
MRILVTGAAGFVGSNLAWRLVKLGHEVTAVDSLSCGVRSNLEGFPGEIVSWDMTRKPEGWGRFDAVFHNGDITDPRHPDDAEVLARNLACFQSVLALAKEGGRRLVYASTAGLYGNGPTPMREDQPKQLLTAYGKSKLEMDRIASEHYGEMDIVGLRYFNVYGPNEGHKGRAASMVWHLAHQMAAGKRPRLFQWGEQKRDFIHVADIVEANLKALTGPSGVYNAGTGVASTFNELVDALNLALGTRLEPDYFPMPYEARTYQGNTQADPAWACEKLGFTARLTLKEGVAEYVGWMREKGVLPR